MPPKHRGLTPPQREILPGMPETPMLPLEPTRRISLAHALRFDFIGIRPEDYADVTDEQVRLASADNLRKSVIGVGQDKHGAIGYRNPETHQLIFIATTAHEHMILNPSIRGLGERAMDVTETARKKAPLHLRSDIAAPERAGGHAVDRRAEELTDFINNELMSEKARLQRFRKMTDAPGFRRLEEPEMRLELTTVLSIDLGNLLEAIKRTRRWSPEQERRARRAMETSFTLDRFENRHIDNFKAIVDLELERDGYLLAIARAKLHEAQRYSKNSTTNAGKF